MGIIAWEQFLDGSRSDHGLLCFDYLFKALSIFKSLVLSINVIIFIVGLLPNLKL